MEGGEWDGGMLKIILESGKICGRGWSGDGGSILLKVKIWIKMEGILFRVVQSW